MDDKKEFVKPEAEIVAFADDDIITFSTNEGAYPDEWTGEPWQLVGGNLI